MAFLIYAPLHENSNFVAPNSKAPKESKILNFKLPLLRQKYLSEDITETENVSKTLSSHSDFVSVRTKRNIPETDNGSASINRKLQNVLSKRSSSGVREDKTEEFQGLLIRITKDNTSENMNKNNDTLNFPRVFLQQIIAKNDSIQEHKIATEELPIISLQRLNPKNISANENSTELKFIVQQVDPKHDSSSTYENSTEESKLRTFLLQQVNPKNENISADKNEGLQLRSFLLQEINPNITENKTANENKDLLFRIVLNPGQSSRGIMDESVEDLKTNCNLFYDNSNKFVKFLSNNIPNVNNCLNEEPKKSNQLKRFAVLAKIEDIPKINFIDESEESERDVTAEILPLLQPRLMPQPVPFKFG